MPCYVVTGKLGSGKNLAAVGRLRGYVERGRPVATNIDLDTRKLCGGDEAARAARIVRLPDFPSSEDLQALGAVDNNDDEAQNGALILDECGVLLNSREWGGKDRMAVVDWMLHSRKLGWDVYLIVQNLNLLDKQLRDALCELIVYVKRMDRVAVPMVGTFVRWLTFGFVRLKLPRIHVGTVMYGQGDGAMNSDTWWFRGDELFGCYRTKQLFSRKYEHGAYSVIPNDHPFKPTGWQPKEQPAQALTAPTGRFLRSKLPEVLTAMELPPEQRIPALRALWRSL